MVHNRVPLSTRFQRHAPPSNVQAVGDDEGAHASFSTCLCLWKQCSEAWASWGLHCDRMYEGSGNTSWLEFAVHCYLQVRACV